MFRRTAPDGTFLEAYADNRRTANTTALDDSPLTEVLVRFSIDHNQWEGRATDLLKELNLIADDDTRRAKAWPKGSNALTNRIRRLGPALRGIGIAVHAKRNSNGSLVTISSLRVHGHLTTEKAEKRSSPSPSCLSITNDQRFMGDDVGDGDDDTLSSDDPANGHRHRGKPI